MPHAGRQANPHILPRPTAAKHMYRWDLQIEHVNNSHAPRQEAAAAGLVRWEAGQEEQPPPHHQPQRRHQSQALCIPEMHNTACIAPSGSPAIL